MWRSRTLYGPLFRPTIYILLVGFGILLLWSAEDEYRGQSDSSTADSQRILPFPPFPTDGCRVGLVPYLIPGEEYRDCDKEIETLARKRSGAAFEKGTGQHLFLTHGKAAVESNGGWTEEYENVDFWLLDDVNSLACFVLLKVAPETRKALPLNRTTDWYTKDRTRFVANFLKDSNKNHNKPLLVLEDFIYHKLFYLDSPKNLFKMVLETGQVLPSARNDRRHFVVPYSTPGNEFLRPAEDVNDRYQIYLRAMCYPGRMGLEQQTLGKKLRAAAVNALANAPLESKVMAKCTCHWCNASVSYRTVRKELAESRYCLVLPGDTSSSRRLADSVAAGCIPVIVGEPWHALPYLGYLDYSKFALFVRIHEPPFARLEGNLSKPVAFGRDPFEEVVLGDGSKLVKELQSANDLLSYLESIPLTEVVRLKRGVRKVAELFVSWNGPAAAEPISHDKTYAMHWALGAACHMMKERGWL